MTFRINNFGYNVTDLVRKFGYRPLRYTPAGELNCVRPLGGDYPRFHIYLKENPKAITLNLHLDQKKPSYEGTHAHGGDYDSETVRAEVDRILECLH
jgi:hypothetical protein